MPNLTCDRTNILYLVQIQQRYLRPPKTNRKDFNSLCFVSYSRTKDKRMAALSRIIIARCWHFEGTLSQSIQYFWSSSQPFSFGSRLISISLSKHQLKIHEVQFFLSLHFYQWCIPILTRFRPQKKRHFHFAKKCGGDADAFFFISCTRRKGVCGCAVMALMQLFSNCNCNYHGDCFFLFFFHFGELLTVYFEFPATNNKIE